MGALHPFQFGHFANASSRMEWMELARKVEATGYAALLVGDHLHGDFSPFTALTMAATVTSTLRLGTYVLADDFYNPVLLARDAASLDILSDGRLELGIGSGFMAGDYTQTGISLDAPGMRVSRLEEALQIVNGVLTQSPFSFAGRYYVVRDVEGIPRPHQQPRPPLMIGGGSKRTLSLAARMSDIVSVNIRTTREGGFDIGSITAAATAQKVEWIRGAAGARFDTLELNILVPFVQVTDEPRRVAEEMLHAMKVPAEIFSPESFLASPSVLIGSVDEIVDMLCERRAQYGFSYIVNWAPIDDFAPVVARLAGR